MHLRIVFDLFATVLNAAQADPMGIAVTNHCTFEPALMPLASDAIEHHDPLDGAALRDQAEQIGIPASSVRAWIARGPSNAVATLAAQWLAAQDANEAWSRCAYTQHDDLWSVILVPRLAEIHGMTTQIDLDRTVDVSVSLPMGAQTPLLLVTRPDGSVARSIPSPSTAVRFDQLGVFTLQILATTPRGPVPFATWHVAAGTLPSPAPDDAADEPPQPTNEYQWLAAINRTRARSGVAPVRPDPLLNALASRRATELAARGAVAHALDRGDSPVTRLTHAQIVADRIAENVARAGTLGEASARLDNSPSHRANRVDPTIDTVGIGISEMGSMVYVVEIFAANPHLTDAFASGGNNAD